MWGSTLPISKLAFAEFSPLALSALRLSLAALPLLGWAALRGQLWPPPAPLRLLMPLGLLAMGGNIALLYLSLVQTSVVDASIISAVTPVGTLALARLFLGERAGPRRWLGASLSLLGVAAVVVLASRGGPQADPPNRLPGDLGGLGPSTVVSVLLAALLLGEVVRAEQLAGGALVLAGVWLALREPSRPPAAAEALARPGRADHPS